MKNYRTSIVLVASLMLATTATPTVCAQETAEGATSETCMLPIKGAYP